jgi:hypothetical protein
MCSSSSFREAFSTKYPEDRSGKRRIRILIRTRFADVTHREWMSHSAFENECVRIAEWPSWRDAGVAKKVMEWVGGSM